MRSWATIHSRLVGNPAGQRPAFVIAYLAFSWAAVSPVHLFGQVVAPPPPSDAPTEDDLQARIKEIEGRTDLADSARAQWLDLLRTAFDATRAGKEWSTKFTELDQAREQAPQRLSEIKNELGQPVPEPKPDIPPDASLTQLEQLVAQQEAELKALQSEATSIDEEKKRRTDRRSAIPQESAAAKQKLQELTDKPPDASPTDESPDVAQARALLQAARKRALLQEIATYDKEIQSYDARSELLTARRDLVSRRIAQKDALVKAWRDILSDRRRVEAERAAREAKRTARREGIMGRPAVKELANANAELAKIRADAGLADKIDRANKDVDAAEKLRARIAEDESSMRGRIDKAGLTKAMGLLLRNRLETLPDRANYKRNARIRATQLADVQVAIIEMEEERRALANIEPLVSSALQSLDPGISDEERQEVASTLRDLYETRRKLFDSLINDSSTYRDALFQLDAKESELVAQVDRTRDFVLERILWVPSTSVPMPADAGRLVKSIQWFLAPTRWRELGAVFLTGLSQHKWYVIFILPILLASLLSRFWLRPYIKSQGLIASRGTTATLVPTIKAILATLALSLRWPIAMILIAVLLLSSFDAPPFVRSVGAGLYTTALFFGAASFFRGISRHEGLADAHFELPEAPLKTMRHSLLLLMSIALPLVFVAVVVEQQTDEDAWSTLGRSCFIVIHVALTFFAIRTRRAMGDVIRESTNAQAGGWVDRLHFVWAPLAIGLPILMIVLSIIGYYYTALRLAILIQETFWMVAGFTLLNAFLMRWLLVARRKLAIEQYKKRRAAAMATAGQGTGASESPVEPEPELDLSAISIQTRTLVRSLVGFGLIGGLWLVWIDVLPALNVLDRVTLWTTTQAVTETLAAPNGAATTAETVQKLVPITLANVLLSVVILFVSYIALRNIPGLMEIAILQQLPLQQSSRYAVTTMTRYIITVVGLVIAFGAIGINWSKVQWLAAAITVGLGFGLQEIFANFVSGLIILFERPVRVGDIVTVGNTTGKVARIQMRATTIVDWDRLELVVPNKDFITTQVVNWTLSDTITRVKIQVGVAYGSDTVLARELLLQVANEHPLVMKDPAPWAMFHEFGDSTLNLTLFAFLAVRDHFPEVMHGLHTGIDQAFRKAGIEIAFPQRDLHIRNIEGPIRVERSAKNRPLERTIPSRED